MNIFQKDLEEKTNKINPYEDSDEEEEEYVDKPRQRTLVFESFSQRLSKLKIRLNSNYQDDTAFYELKRKDINKITDQGNIKFF
jgi:hypothetical protein